MDREARLRRIAARAAPLGVLTASLLLAACVAAPRPRVGLSDREFVPTGEVVTARHIGMIGTRCGPPAPGPVRLEARQTEGVFRNVNQADRALDLYYDTAGWGDPDAYLMFFIRFRDSSGRVLRARGQACGWWSVKLGDSHLYYDDDWPRRLTLSVPAGGHLDIRHDQAALTAGWDDLQDAPAPVPPCEMQVRLWTYPGARTWEAIAADSEWLSAPCPSDRER